MAILSDKTEDKVKKTAPVADAGGSIVVGRNGTLIVPRLSEKGSMLNRMNKFVFKVEGKVNKVELKKAIERTFGAKVTGINMITVSGKARRSGRTVGRTSNFKKAIVTLAPDSKKIDTIQGA